MREESGRSLIEIIGVMAIAAIMTAAGIAMYKSIRNNQIRRIAGYDMEQIAKNVKLLMEMRGSYEGVSVDYLIKAGVLKTGDAPIGGKDWSVTSNFDGTSFAINLTELSEGECAYFSTVVPKWASAVIVNGIEADPASNCFGTATNNISIVIQ